MSVMAFLKRPVTRADVAAVCHETDERSVKELCDDVGRPINFIVTECISDLTFLLPTSWPVAINHALISPVEGYADWHDRIGEALKQPLKAYSLHFLIGELNSKDKVFTVTDVTDEEHHHASHILVYLRYNKLVGAGGLNVSDLKCLRKQFAYYHDCSEDAYKQVGTQVFALRVEDFPLIRALVQKTFERMTNVLCKTGMMLEQFATNAERYAHLIRTELTSLFEDMPDGLEAKIRETDPDIDGKSYGITFCLSRVVDESALEYPCRDMVEAEESWRWWPVAGTNVQKQLISGNCYWYDGFSYDKCREDVKALKTMFAER